MAKKYKNLNNVDDYNEIYSDLKKTGQNILKNISNAVSDKESFSDTDLKDKDFTFKIFDIPFRIQIEIYSNFKSKKYGYVKVNRILNLGEDDEKLEPYRIIRDLDGGVDSFKYNGNVYVPHSAIEELPIKEFAPYLLEYLISTVVEDTFLIP